MTEPPLLFLFCDSSSEYAYELVFENLVDLDGWQVIALSSARLIWKAIHHKVEWVEPVVRFEPPGLPKDGDLLSLSHKHSSHRRDKLSMEV